VTEVAVALVVVLRSLSAQNTAWFQQRWAHLKQRASAIPWCRSFTKTRISEFL
jgi:hypothetical protein